MSTFAIIELYGNKMHFRQLLMARNANRVAYYFNSNDQMWSKEFGKDFMKQTIDIFIMVEELELLQQPNHF